jgi:hypothetical protein
MPEMTKTQLLKQVLNEDDQLILAGDKCAGARDAVKAACKNVDKPVDDPEFPKDCDDALDILMDCMDKYYG